VWPVVIVLLPEGFHNSLRLSTVPEDFTIQTFIPQLIVEALNVAILPRAAWRNEQGLAVGCLQPPTDCPGDKLRPIITAQVAGVPRA